MAGFKFLVLGGTGPAGICLLRELVYRNHATVVYARSPSKIPKDLASNPLIDVRCTTPGRGQSKLWAHTTATLTAGRASILIFPTSRSLRARWMTSPPSPPP